MKVNPQDLRVDTFTRGDSFVYMRVVHIPTGLSCEGNTWRSTYKLREQLIDEIRDKITRD